MNVNDETTGAPTPELVQEPKILLNIVSPQSEVVGRLTFPDTPVSTTIAELKAKLQAAVVTHPAPERQKIIWRGKPLLNPAETLGNVLGQDVIEGGGPLTMHLILRPPENTGGSGQGPSGSATANEPHDVPQLGDDGFYPELRYMAGHMPPYQEPSAHARAYNRRIVENAAIAAQQGPNVVRAGNAMPLGVQHMGAASPAYLQTLNQLVAQHVHAIAVQHNQAQAQQQAFGGNSVDQGQHAPAAHTPGVVTQNTPIQTHYNASVIPETPTGNNPVRVVINQTTTTTIPQLLAPTARVQNVQGMNTPFPAVPGTSQGLNSPPARLADNNNGAPLPDNITGNILRAGLPSSATAVQLNNRGGLQVYLVSSPTGPEALLLSPNGTFTTPGYPGGTTVNLSTATGTVNPQQTTQPAPNPDVVAPVAVADAQAPQNQQDPAAELLRILIPLGGHLWLLVRLLGFVYFFTSGAGWQRTLLLGFIALVVFIAQTGIFQPLVDTLWTPIRRHLEELIQVEHNVPIANGRAQPGDVNRGGNDAQPSPEQLAQRLLRERNQRGGSWIEVGARRAERAVALFVASLVPGVGERHIAAREAAEAVRDRERREAEELASQAAAAAHTEEEVDTSGEANDAEGNE